MRPPYSVLTFMSSGPRTALRYLTPAARRRARIASNSASLTRKQKCWTGNSVSSSMKSSVRPSLTYTGEKGPAPDSAQRTPSSSARRFAEARWSLAETMVWSSSIELVPELQFAFRDPVHLAVLQPFERSLEEQQVVLLPHRVVRRAREIDDDLLFRAEVRVQVRDALGRDLLVVHARHHQEGRVHLGDDRLVEAPRRHRGRAPDARAPFRADRVGGEHLRPHRGARAGLVLVGAAHLAVPVRGEV